MSEITERLQDLRNRYQGRFAGQPRITRDLSELQAMIADLDGLKSDDAAETELIGQLRASWSSEADAIETAQKSGAGVRELQDIQQWFDETVGRYRRNFAGQNRATRDIGILFEMIADLEWLSARLDNAPADAPADQADELEKVVEQHATLCKGEVDAIRQARRSGTQQERAMRLANLANGQFARYRSLFANQNRVSRRPSSLDTIVRVLTEIRDEMITLGTVPGTPHMDNLGIVDRRLGAYQTEQTALHKMAQENGAEARGLAIGDAANKLFATYREEYAGKPRTQADPDRLNEIWEQLWCLTRELGDLSKLTPSPTLHRNLQITRDMLRLFSREHSAISDARSGQAS
jgi:tetrahydromethanopterin S-methyltransferase subunit G